LAIDIINVDGMAYKGTVWHIYVDMKESCNFACLGDLVVIALGAIVARLVEVIS